METSKASLKELAAAARNLVVILCVEDLPRSCLEQTAEEMLELIEAQERADYQGRSGMKEVFPLGSVCPMCPKEELRMPGNGVCIFRNSPAHKSCGEKIAGKTMKTARKPMGIGKKI